MTASRLLWRLGLGARSGLSGLCQALFIRDVETSPQGGFAIGILGILVLMEKARDKETTNNNQQPTTFWEVMITTYFDIL